MKLFATFLILYSSIAFSEPYYGYLGNCNNPIYMFDFENKKYESYIEEFKYTKKGKEKTYRLIKNNMRTTTNNKFILETKGREPIVLYLDPSDKMVWGENKEYGKHWYKPCNFQKIPELIKNAKENS